MMDGLVPRFGWDMLLVSMVVMFLIFSAKRRPRE